MPKNNDKNETVTLAEFLKQGLAGQLLFGDRQLTAKTLAEYAGVLRNRVIPRLGSRRLNELQDELPRFAAEVTDEGLNAATVHRILSVLKRVMDAAHLCGLAREPFKIPAAQPERERIIGLEAEVVERVLAAAVDNSEHLLFRLIADTGMRVGELRSLMWKDFLLAQPSVSITYRRRPMQWHPNFASTTAFESVQGRLVPLSERLLALLNELIRGSADSYVFADKVIQGIGRRFREAVVHANLDQLEEHARSMLQPYDLRRLFGSRLLSRGVAWDLVSKWMGVSLAVARSLGFRDIEAQKKSPPRTFNEERAILLTALDPSGSNKDKS